MHTYSMHKCMHILILQTDTEILFITIDNGPFIIKCMGQLCSYEQLVMLFNLL